MDATAETLTIGQIARLSGPTRRALRHYDELGVLRPAHLADGNGYRLYGRDQVEVARRIRALRALEVPLDEIRRLAGEMFDYTWTYLEKDDRTGEETERMISAAHASRLFWLDIGTPVNRGRGEWQLARVYAVGGDAAAAARHEALGREAALRVEDDEDRELVLGDLSTLPAA